MNRLLLLLVSLLLVSSVAMAADYIGIYSDATGTTCNLGNIAGQFSTSATVIQTDFSGVTGSRFKINFPPGTAFFGMPTPYVSIGLVESDISFGYGACLTGHIIIGTLNAVYAAGVVEVVPADNFSDIIYADCSFVEKTATGGKAYIGMFGHCPGDNIAVEPSTWGSVKALYR